MEKKAIFTLMRVYRCRNGEFDIESRAIVLTDRVRDPGTQIRFTDEGKEYFGSVISCIETDEDSELYRLLYAVAGRTVYVANFIRNKTQKQKRQPMPPLLCRLFST